MTENCENCRFSRSIGNEAGVACHRFPPTITHAEGGTVTSFFPLLANESWCGEYKRRAN